ncbi:MAG: hypothetical protein FJ033_11340 [Chloroflexi bacterium]|nr:hypothetical protein [Chloroflexota bacterium]
MADSETLARALAALAESERDDKMAGNHGDVLVGARVQYRQAGGEDDRRRRDKERRTVRPRNDPDA